MPFVYEVVDRDNEKYTILDHGPRFTPLCVCCGSFIKSEEPHPPNQTKL